ncbi:hypothetical protein F5X97DRAFT_63914 [Nemania serpens]|nr:hypothetical protein F5X97DRAFT_63914 [Nemania serpens]
MEFSIDTATATALHTDRTARCLYRAKFGLASRKSRDVIAWAQSGVMDLTRAMLQTASVPVANLDIHLNIVCLLSNRPYALICYDVFLDGCDPAARLRIEASTSQPIHEIIKKHHTAYAQRNKKLDATIRAEFTKLQGFDKGPRPYFVDTLNPPIYIDGVRTEPGENQDEVDESDDSAQGSTSDAQDRSADARGNSQENVG